MNYRTKNHMDTSPPILDFLKTKCSTSPAAIFAYALLALGSAYTLIQRSDRFPLLSIPELAWNLLVYATPPSIVLALDGSRSQASTSDDGDKSTYATSRTFAAKSSAMRRILGLDGVGVLTGLQRTRSLSGLGTMFKSTPSKALPGLGNWDNSCYQNSILQGLSSLPSLYAFLEEAHVSSEEEAMRSTNNALKFLIEELNSSKNNGQRIWTPPALKNMSSWQQQDAQEYYSKVVDEMEKEIVKTIDTLSKGSSPGARRVGLESLTDVQLDPEPSTTASEKLSITPPTSSTNPSPLLRNPLEGLLAQRVGCLQCGFVEGLSLIPFNCLTVPLGRGFSYDVSACLDEYTKLEPISGVECASCTLLRSKQQLERLLAAEQSSAEEEVEPQYALSGPARLATEGRLKAVDDALSSADFAESTLTKKCMIPSKNRVTSTKSRQAVIARPPKALAIHVNRSMFDEYSGTLSKNHADVRFPQTLDLSSWCLGSSAKNGGSEHWNTNPSESMLVDSRDALDTEQKPAPSASLYNLRAVVTHYGRHENGHYIAYRQTPIHGIFDNKEEANDTWWRLSDEDVSTVSEDHVLAQGGVFMMFYERQASFGPACEAEAPTPSRNVIPSRTDLTPVLETTTKEDITLPQELRGVDGESTSEDEPTPDHGFTTDQSTNSVEHVKVDDPLSNSLENDATDKESAAVSSKETGEMEATGSRRIVASESTTKDILRPVAEAGKEVSSQIPRMRTSSIVASRQDFDHLGTGSGLVQAV